MNFFPNKLRNGLAVSLFAASVFSPNGWALTDVLDTPAAPTEMASSALLLDVESTGDRLVSVGARGHILLSDDAGENWRQAPSPVSVLLTAVSFPSAQKGWAVGHGGVILSTRDGGESWVKQFDGNIANQSIIQQAEDRVAELEEELDSASEDMLEDLEYALEDAQFALEDARFDAEVGASKPFLDVHFLDEQTGFAVGAYGFLFKTSDAGRSWENYGRRIENPDRFHLNAISAIEGGTLMIVGEAGVMFRSQDQGETWETIYGPYDGSFFGVIGTGEDDVALAYGLRGHLFRSEDAGETWDQIDLETESTLMGASIDGSGRVTVVGNSGILLFSEDGGRSFTETTRENRLSNADVEYISARSVVVVGEFGVISSETR